MRHSPHSSSAHQLAKKYHPDQNKEAGSKEKFVEIQAAYDVRKRSPCSAPALRSRR